MAIRAGPERARPGEHVQKRRVQENASRLAWPYEQVQKERVHKSASRRASPGERVQKSASRRTRPGERIQESASRRVRPEERVGASESRRAHHRGRVQASASWKVCPCEQFHKNGCFTYFAMCVQMDTSYRFSGAESVEPTVQMMSTMTLHLKAIRQSGKSNQLTPAGYPYRLSLLFHSRSQLEKSLKKLLQKKTFCVGIIKPRKEKTTSPT